MHAVRKGPFAQQEFGRRSLVQVAGQGFSVNLLVVVALLTAQAGVKPNLDPMTGSMVSHVCRGSSVP